MDITDIPDQLTKAFQYSLRSRATFFLSLVTAMAVFGIAYDLMYGFWYTRWHNVKDAEYGTPYFAGMALAAVVGPLTIGLVAYLRARARARPFKAGQIGIAIAPFEVFSVAPETLGTANVLQALDIVSTQFFLVVQNTLNEYAVAKDFEFRFLPPYANIHSQEEAKQQVAKLRATMVVWGSITQRSRQPMEVRLEMQGAEKDYRFSQLSIEKFPMLPLQFFIFFEAGKMVLAAGDAARAVALLSRARVMGLTVEKGTEGLGFVSEIDGMLAALGGGGVPKP